METYPLLSLSIEEAMKLQFWAVDCMTKEFEGQESLSRGDLGVVRGVKINRLQQQKPSGSLRGYLVRKPCTCARGRKCSDSLWTSYNAALRTKDLAHKAPIYNTTATSFEMLGFVPVAGRF